ncbi:MAG TPA: response regulator [Candidatus Saccharimonadales bacterium]|nr:response regulator [Candidatus Saccharimonadales bacterium]
MLNSAKICTVGTWKNSIYLTIKIYIILAIAILSLVIGAVGLIIGLQRPASQSSLPAGMRVLIVEDETKIALLLKKGLALESFASDICSSGEDALELTKDNEYQVMVIDRHLAGQLEGIDVCKMLRKRGYKVPILLLTARDQLKDKIEGLNSGADDYMVEPFDFEELIARVRALARRPHPDRGYVGLH